MAYNLMLVGLITIVTLALVYNHNSRTVTPVKILSLRSWLGEFN